MRHTALIYIFFFFNDTATTEIYTLSLHDALPISRSTPGPAVRRRAGRPGGRGAPLPWHRCSRADERTGRRHSRRRGPVRSGRRSEEHTSELQSRQYLVCRLLLEKKKHNENSAIL